MYWLKSYVKQKSIVQASLWKHLSLLHWIIFVADIEEKWKRISYEKKKLIKKKTMEEHTDIKDNESV